MDRTSNSINTLNVKEDMKKILLMSSTDHDHVQTEETKGFADYSNATGCGLSFFLPFIVLMYVLNGRV